ncbi:MAG: cell division protein ZapA [Clostridiales bacterium]|nr:cell division protein ZapA [Clostridiales bacterium]
MEKKKYDVVIADVEMAIISDEREDFVMRLVNDLDQKIREITLSSKRCSKMDAALLVALDTNSERLKAEKRIRNLEAQIGLYDANLRRLREENAKLKEIMLSGKNAQAEEATEQEPESEETQPDIEQLDMTQTESEEAAAEEETEVQAEPEAQPEKASEESADRGDKLRQIESLLRGKNNG